MLKIVLWFDIKYNPILVSDESGPKVLYSFIRFLCFLAVMGYGPYQEANTEALETL